MSKVLGRLWGGSGRVFGSPKPILVSPRIQNEVWGRLWEGFGKALGALGKATDRPLAARPPDRLYIYKLPINRFSGPILVVVVAVLVAVVVI